MFKRSEIFSNHLPRDTLVAITVRLLETAGLTVSDAENVYIVMLAERGWCAAEIARNVVRVRFPKGDSGRRRYLVALTKLGAHRM